jgi:hypothetical protein
MRSIKKHEDIFNHPKGKMNSSKTNGFYRKKEGPTAYIIPEGVERLKRDLWRACSEALPTVEHLIY